MFIVDNLRIGGGIENVISTLSSYLSKNYRIFILTFRDFKNLYPFKGKYYSLKENLKNCNKLINSFKIDSLIRLKRIFKLVKIISPHLIISNMYYTDIFIILTKILFRIKIPLIIVIHTNLKMKFGNKNRYFNYILKVLYSLKFVNKIITVSKEIQQILKCDYRINDKKISTIYNGIYIERIIKLKDEQIFDYKNIFYDIKKIKFINIGRLVKLKGHFYFIIASNVYGNKDLIKNGKTGFLFNPIKKVSLLKKLFLYKEKSFSVEQILLEAKNVVSLYYNINNIANQIIEFLKYKI